MAVGSSSSNIKRSNNSNNNKRHSDNGKKNSKKIKKDEEIASLESRIREETPDRGYAPPLQQRVAFRALPLSEPTLKGLEEAKTPFTTMTDIQNACIPHALAGRDILGAAKTGSGKTLAFIIPALECLYRNRFAPIDGPGCVVLSPTRELAMQIFQVLKVVGKFHTFSVGLLIGGKKDFFEEQAQVPKTNIIIATPGRLLQHLEQTPYLSMDELRILVLDEADRILDMGFRDQLIRILEYLPKPPENNNKIKKGGRQTLLFSATQTHSVSQLATLSLNAPEYIGVHDKDKNYTPEKLQQSYVVVPLEHKLNATYSFIKTHLKCKSIIFMASCSQVRFSWELFCSLRPGVVVMALHGKLTQEKRTKIYFDFINRPNGAVLFATDIAARGLDFPNVDWVVQIDAPEDKDTYIHRVGRTARYRSGGKSLLLLTPQEEENGFMQLLQRSATSSSSTPRKVKKDDDDDTDDDDDDDKNKKNTTNAANNIAPLKKLNINPTKTIVVTQRASALVASNVKLNTLAKKAFHSYVRSIILMPNKKIFNAQKLQLDEFGKSLGLASTPSSTLRLVRSTSSANNDSGAEDARDQYRKTKNVNKKLQKLKEQIKAEKLAKRVGKLGDGKNADLVNNKDDTKKVKTDDDDDDDDGILFVLKGRSERENIIKSVDRGSDNDDDSEEDNDDDDLPNVDIHKVSKPRSKKINKIRIHGSNHEESKHVVFDDDGEAISDKGGVTTIAVTNYDIDDKEKLLKEANEEYVEKVRKRLQENLERDRTEEKDRIRQKHKKRRLVEKGEKDEEESNNNTDGVVLLGAQDGDDEDNVSVSSNSSSNSSSSDSSNSSSSSSDSSKSQREDEGDEESSDESVDLKKQEDLALSLIGK